MFWHDTFLELTTKLKHLKIWKTLRWECGSILIFTAVAIPIFFGLMGIAYDVGNLYMHKARLQNIADAAALAGARAFADSQANADENERDKVDQKITVTSYKPSVSYSVNDKENERIKNHGMDSSPHPHADEEADKYIYNNLINLGNDISTDLYSHYALLSKEINPRTFYRVGLTEDVNLHFLPIIRGIGKTQKVGVEAIVLLSEDTGQEIPATVFSNLFTYTGKLHAEATGKDGKTVKTTFEGQISYTGDMNASKSDYFEVQGDPKKPPLPDLYADTGKTKENNPKKHSTEIDLAQYITFFREKVEQAKSMNACVELDMSNENERKKLIPKNDNKVAYNINTLKSNNNYNDSDKDKYNDLYEKQEKDEYENLMYTISYLDEFGITKEFTFSIDQRYGDDDYRRYYSIDDRGDNSIDDNHNYSIDDNRNKLYCLKYVLDDGPTIRVPSYMNEQTILNDGFPYTDSAGRVYQYYVVDGSKDRIYYSIDIVKNNSRHWVYFVTTNKMVIKDAYYNTGGGISQNGDPKTPNFALYPWMKDTKDYMGTHFKYSTQNLRNVDYRLINFRAFKDEKFTQPTPRNLILNANVFHLIKGDDTTFSSPTNLVFDTKLTGHGNISEPIYIFDETGNEMNLTVNATNERPVVIIHTGSTPVNVTINKGLTFNGTIYAPNANAVITPCNGSTFKGNIVANDISVVKMNQDYNSASTFIHENHLESDTDLYGKILQHAQSDNSGEAQLFSDPSDNTQPPSNKFNSSWENWYSYVGSETAKAWFDSLNRNQQIAFWRSWDSASRPQNSMEYEQWDNQGLYRRWYEDDGDGTPGWKKKWYFSEWANSDKAPKSEEILAAQNNVDIEHVFDTKIRLINPRLEANPFKA